MIVYLMFIIFFCFYFSRRFLQKIIIWVISQIDNYYRCRYLKKYYKRFGLESIDEILKKLKIKKFIKCKECKNNITLIYNKSCTINASPNFYVFDVIIDGTRDIEEFNEKMNKKICSICTNLSLKNDRISYKLTGKGVKGFSPGFPYQECTIGMLYLCDNCNKVYCFNCINPTTKIL